MQNYNKPMAAYGLTSYRLKGRYGYIMLGAKSDSEALREALRSTSKAKIENLEIWNGSEYKAVTN
jgi:hypothetical protein